MPERLHKYLAHCGIASRRKAEEYILAGRVEVNGEPVTELGVQIEPGVDAIRFDGKPVHEEKKVYLLLHKPRGVTTTSEDELGRKTVVDLLGPDVPERVYPVGRLDRDSEGLLVLTNDGDLAWYLTHPSCGVNKTYHVVVEGTVTDGMIADLVNKGARLGPDLIKPIAVKLLRRYPNSTSMHITVAEGVNREIRRLFAMLGHEVKKLLRLEIGPLKIQKLPRGQYRPLTRRELSTLFHGMERVGAAMEEPAPGGRGRKRGPVKKRQRTGKPDPAAHARRDSRKPGGASATGSAKGFAKAPGKASGKGTGNASAKGFGKGSGKPSGKIHGNRQTHESHAAPPTTHRSAGASTEPRGNAKPVHPIHAPRGAASGAAPGHRKTTGAPRPGSVATGNAFKESGASSDARVSKAPGAGRRSGGSGGANASKGYGAPKGHGSSKGHGASKGHGSSKSHGAPKGHGSSKSHGAPKGHAASKNQGASKGFGAPRPGTGKPSKPSRGEQASKPTHAGKPSRPAKAPAKRHGPAAPAPRSSTKPGSRSGSKPHPMKGRKR